MFHYAVDLDKRVVPDNLLRLARSFGNSDSFWLGLKMDYDLDIADDAFAA